MEITECPFCGEQMTMTHAQAAGTVEIYYEADGIVAYVNQEKLRFNASDTVRCATCHRIRRDVEIVGGHVYPRNSS